MATANDLKGTMAMMPAFTKKHVRKTALNLFRVSCLEFRVPRPPTRNA